MRGKGPKSWPSTLHTGITPAYAGKSYDGKDKFRTQMDHPRVCGEKCKMTPVFLS